MMRSLMVAAAAALVLTGPARAGEKVALDKLPKPVAEAVAKRFPKAEAKGASKDGEGDKLVYEVSLKENGKGIDVSLTPAGAITQIEQELAFKDLPKPVAATLEKKYPKAAYKIIEAVIAVKDGKEVLEYYEAVVVTADKKTFEAEVLPDGKFKGETEKADKKPPQLARAVIGDEKKNEKDDKKGEKKGEKKNEKDDDDDDLPKPVAAAIKSKFPGMKVVEAEKDKEDGKTVYEVTLKAKSAVIEAKLTAKGEVLSVKVKKGEDDEDDDKKGKKKGDEDKNEKGEKGKKKNEKGDRN